MAAGATEKRWIISALLTGTIIVLTAGTAVASGRKATAPKTEPAAAVQSATAMSSQPEVTDAIQALNNAVRINVPLVVFGIGDIELERRFTKYTSWVGRLAFATPLLDVYTQKTDPDFRGFELGIELRIRPMAHPDLTGVHIGVGLDFGGLWIVQDNGGLAFVAATLSIGYEWLLAPNLSIGVMLGISPTLLSESSEVLPIPRAAINAGYHF